MFQKNREAKLMRSVSFSHLIFRKKQLSSLSPQVCWWDVRKGGNPEGTITLDQSHLDPVYKTIWMNAKTGTEFFTGSTDGTVSP
jgi:hypothetical protein